MGPLKAQLLTYTAASGDTSGTVTADQLIKIEHILIGEGAIRLTAAPTFSSNVATLAFTVPATAAATASLAVTTPIVLTSVATGQTRNGTTFKTVVNAAAANPTDTVLVAFTGTASAIICTVTPNDGTNNGATPVNLTTAELKELINTGAVVGKTITLTDASSLRALQTATGGDATDLAHSGEGDNVTATFASGVTGGARGSLIALGV